MVKNPSCKAGDNVDSVPGQAVRISHATGQLSPCITTTESPTPQLETVGPCNERQSRTRLSNFTFTFHFHAWEKEMATHSSVLAWRIPGTGEPGGLLSMGSHRVRHD